MNLLIDAVAVQKSKGTEFPKMLEKHELKDEAKALQILTTKLRAILSEAVAHDLPIMKAFAHAHVCCMQKVAPNYETILQEHRAGIASGAFKQSDRGIELLEQIRREFSRLNPTT